MYSEIQYSHTHSKLGEECHVLPILGLSKIISIPDFYQTAILIRDPQAQSPINFRYNGPLFLS